MENKNEKRKMLICLKNFKIGGITSACLPFIKEMSRFYDIDVFCFWQYGPCKDDFRSVSNVLPEYGRLIPFSAGLRESMKVSFFCFFRKIFLALSSKIFTNQYLLRKSTCGLRFQQKYDVAISYAQIDSERTLSGCGTAQIVLDRVDAKKKIQYIHDDLGRADHRTKGILSIYRRFDKVICLSMACAYNAQKYLLVPVCASPNFYNVEKAFGKLAVNGECCSDDTLHLLVLSRFGGEKGIFRLVRCFCAALPNFSKKVVLKIYGDGPEKNKVQRFIAKNGLSASVLIYPASKTPLNLISSCDALVVCSFHEARPMVVDEAHMMGKRCFLAEYSSCHEQAFDSDVIVQNDEKGITDGLVSFVNGFSRANHFSKPFSYFTCENGKIAHLLLNFFSADGN